VNEKLVAKWQSAKAQFAAMPGALARDMARDLGTTYHSILLSHSSLSVVHQPGSTKVELSTLHQNVEGAEQEQTEGQEGLVGLDDQLGGYSGPEMDES
jgi:hypothetical protein